MKDLETMQREGREKVYKDIIYWVMNPSAREAIFTPKEANDVIDQHTANTWKACKDAILESGLLEEKDDLDVIVQEKLKEDRERIFKEIDWYFKTTDYKEVLVSDLQNIINSDTDVTN